MVHQLIRFRLIKNVWYQCEIDLASIKAGEILKVFKQYDDTQNSDNR